MHQFEHQNQNKTKKIAINWQLKKDDNFKNENQPQNYSSYIYH